MTHDLLVSYAMDINLFKKVKNKHKSGRILYLGERMKSKRLSNIAVALLVALLSSCMGRMAGGGSTGG